MENSQNKQSSRLTDQCHNDGAEDDESNDKPFFIFFDKFTECLQERYEVYNRGDGYQSKQRRSI